jgi:environmental stress-induced protein Ves
VVEGALAVAAERFDLRDIAPQPWKNGAGLTREIAVGPRGAGATDFDWRFSVAEVERAAPFSVFPGIDRCIVLLAGAGLHLRSGDDHRLDHRLDTPCAPFHFSGDVPLAATLIGGPSRDLNVMTRRGGLRSEVVCHATSARLHAEGPAMLLCCTGAWRTDDPAAPTLGPQQGLLWRFGTLPVHVDPQPGALEPRLLFVRLLVAGVCHDATQ